MFQRTPKVGDVVRVKSEPNPYVVEPMHGKVWHEFMGKTGIVVDMTFDEDPEAERATVWIESQEAEFFLNEIEVICEG